MAHITLFSDVTTTPGHYLFIFLKEQRNRLSTPRQWGKTFLSYFHEAPEAFPLFRAIKP